MNIIKKEKLYMEGYEQGEKEMAKEVLELTGGMECDDKVYLNWLREKIKWFV